MRLRGEQSALGTCCICESPGATVLLFLAARSVVHHHGWACRTCGLSADGATAVLCNACAARYEYPGAPHIELQLRFACRGYPGTDGRLPFSDLRGEHQHIRHRHPELGEDPAHTVLPGDKRFHDSPPEGRGCFCSRCGHTIFAGATAIRVWLERGAGEYRYHPACGGADPVRGDDPYSAYEDAPLPAGVLETRNSVIRPVQRPSQTPSGPV